MAQMYGLLFSNFIILLPTIPLEAGQLAPVQKYTTKPETNDKAMHKKASFFPNRNQVGLPLEGLEAFEELIIIENHAWLKKSYDAILLFI